VAGETHAALAPREAHRMPPTESEHPGATINQSKHFYRACKVSNNSQRLKSMSTKKEILAIM